MTLGTRPKGTMVTGRPFDSVNRFGLGMTKSLAWPGAGGACFCSAPAVTVAARVSATRTERLSPPLIAPPLSPRHCRGSALRLRAGLPRRDHIDGTIAGPKILACRFLDERRRDLGEPILEVLIRTDRCRKAQTMPAGWLAEARELFTLDRE